MDELHIILIGGICGEFVLVCVVTWLWLGAEVRARKTTNEGMRELTSANPDSPVARLDVATKQNAALVEQTTLLRQQLESEAVRRQRAEQAEEELQRDNAGLEKLVQDARESASQAHNDATSSEQGRLAAMAEVGRLKTARDETARKYGQACKDLTAARAEVERLKGLLSEAEEESSRHHMEATVLKGKARAALMLWAEALGIGIVEAAEVERFRQQGTIGDFLPMN